MFVGSPIRAYRGAASPWLILFSVMLLALLATSCSLFDDDDDNGGSDGGPIGARLSEDEAIDRVRDSVGSGIMTFDLPYQEEVIDTIPCTETDYELDALGSMCTQESPLRPFGVREIVRNETKCCKPVDVPLDDGQWSAIYEGFADEWTVEVTISVDSVSETQSWIVDDDSGDVFAQ